MTSYRVVFSAAAAAVLVACAAVAAQTPAPAPKPAPVPKAAPRLSPALSAQLAEISGQTMAAAQLALGEHLNLEALAADVMAGHREALLEAESAVETAAEAAAASLSAHLADLESLQEPATASASAEARADAAKRRAVADAQREVLRAKIATRERSAYARGTAALDASRWTDAVEAFARAAEAKDAKAAGALYWKAYAEYKLARKADALATIQALAQAYADSAWLKEARALQVEISGATAATAAAEGDDELKLLAISGLVNADDERAVPMLEKILASQQTPQLKKRALFVLSRSKSPRAREVLLGVARGGSNPDLQLESLRYVAMLEGPEHVTLLSQLYGTTKDIDIRRRILEAYGISGQRDLLLQAARSEADTSLRAQAIRHLGMLRSTGELDSLYAAESSPEVRTAILEAYMMGGQSDRLMRIATTDKDATLRVRAIEMMGALGQGSREKSLSLAPLYDAEGQTKEGRRAVVNALSMGGDAAALVTIARKETDPAMRKVIIERLSHMKAREATDYLLEIINK